MDPIARLPVVLVQRILAFTDGRYVLEPVPGAPTLPTELLEGLAEVSGAWRTVIAELRALHDASTFEAHLPTAAPHEVAAMLAGVRYRGRELRSLSLRIGTNEHIRAFEILKARAEAARVDDLVIPWARVLGACPNLQRLDLAGVPLHSPHLIQLLEAAGQCCPKLQALILPKKEWHRGPVDATWLPVMAALETALRVWHRRGAGRGLIQLTVPQRMTKTSGSAMTLDGLTDAFLHTIARYCPNLEYLDGWKTTYEEVHGQIRCEELLYCSKGAWAAFCRSCPHIRELHWYVVPFIDDFFEVFGQYPKPQLKKLTLSGGDHVNFNSDIVLGTYYRDGPWSFTPAGLRGIFRSCPALEELRVVLQFPPNDDEERQHALDDAFLLSLTMHCPNLRRLEIMELEDDDFYGPIQGITDAGICALARLPHLECLRLKATGCSVKGLLALIHNSPRRGPARMIELTVGSDIRCEHDSGRRTSLYGIMAEVLQVLLLNSMGVGQRKFTLTLRGKTLRNGISPQRKRSVSALIQELSRRCPSVYIAIRERHRSIVATISTVQTDGPCGIVDPTSARERMVETKHGIEALVAPLVSLRDFFMQVCDAPWLRAPSRA